jgi:hypothetical protein
MYTLIVRRLDVRRALIVDNCQAHKAPTKGREKKNSRFCSLCTRLQLQ